MTKRVMISSTVMDLPDHRKEIVDACLRQGMYPVMMEHLPASDVQATNVSLDLVNSADIYLGIFAHRYGYIPKLTAKERVKVSEQISITEIEYNQAVKRGIPRLIFIINKDHPVKIDDIEQGKGASKLKTFIERLKKDNTVNFFNSPEDLRANAINSLSFHRESDMSQIHYVSSVPEPPEVFVAHQYTLLQERGLIGRQEELKLLTDWVNRKNSDVYRARILSIVAIGGMGKSALTWKWFTEIAPQEMIPLAGRIWWSFYESDASFENFVIRALAYVSSTPIKVIQNIPAFRRETSLLNILNSEPYLIVLDGVERLLVAYARMDASHLEDSKVDVQEKVRKTADPRAGQFLKKLAQIKMSRVLISTRLRPVELETVGGDDLPNTFHHELKGPTDSDAVELWQSVGVTGSSELLIPIFNTFGNHPLLIQALAAEIKLYRKAPGNFEKWLDTHTKFNPAKSTTLQKAMGHVMGYALRGLDETAKQVLEKIAALRMPAQYDTLAALLIGGKNPCKNERQLDEVLTELEDRGLVGWDKRANRYDLHPIVRGVVWNDLAHSKRRDVYTSLHAHFEALSNSNYRTVSTLDDLIPTIEFYNTLIGLQRYGHAIMLFHNELDWIMLRRLSANQKRIELLEMLFPAGLDQLPSVDRPDMRAFVLNGIANGFHSNGQPRQAIKFYDRAREIYSEFPSENLSICSSNLSEVHRFVGTMYRAETFAFRALQIGRILGDRFREAVSLANQALILGSRNSNKSLTSLNRALKIVKARSDAQYAGVVNSNQAQVAIWFGNVKRAFFFR